MLWSPGQADDPASHPFQPSPVVNVDVSGVLLVLWQPFQRQRQEALKVHVRLSELCLRSGGGGGVLNFWRGRGGRNNREGGRSNRCRRGQERTRQARSWFVAGVDPSWPLELPAGYIYTNAHFHRPSYTGTQTSFQSVGCSTKKMVIMKLVPLGRHATPIDTPFRRLRAVEKQSGIWLGFEGVLVYHGKCQISTFLGGTRWKRSIIAGWTWMDAVLCSTYKKKHQTY